MSAPREQRVGRGVSGAALAEHFGVGEAGGDAQLPEARLREALAVVGQVLRELLY